jgi:hypothetical protein
LLLLLAAVAVRAERPETAEDRERAERLEALGYVEAVPDDPDPARRGVVLRTERAWDGVHYYCAGTSVRFLDMDGKVLHEIPLSEPAAPNSGCLADPYRDDLVAVVRRPILSLEEWNGTTKWSRRGPFHHDVGMDAEGRLYGLEVLPGKIRRDGEVFDILGQAVVVLDPNGSRSARST